MAQRNPTAITETLSVDDPLIQDAGFAFDADDRQFIDNQARGTQKHLVDALIRGRHATYARVASGSATIGTGIACCLASVDEGEAKVTLATSGALALAIAAFGVVVQSAAPDSYALVAFGGTLPPTITGLAKNAPGYVRVNTTTGALEQVSTLAFGDFGIGTVDNAGYMQVVPGLGSGSASAGGATDSLQYKKADGSFGGSTSLGLLSDDGDVHHTGTPVHQESEVLFRDEFGPSTGGPVASPTLYGEARATWGMVQSTAAGGVNFKTTQIGLAGWGDVIVTATWVVTATAHAARVWREVCVEYARVSGTWTVTTISDTTKNGTLTTTLTFTAPNDHQFTIAGSADTLSGSQKCNWVASAHFHVTPIPAV